MLLLSFEDTYVCPRRIAVSYVVYCATEGVLFKPLHVSVVDKWFSTMSEFKYAGVMLEISLRSKRHVRN